MLNLSNFRKFEMINEVAKMFPIEAIGGNNAAKKNLPTPVDLVSYFELFFFYQALRILRLYLAL